GYCTWAPIGPHGFVAWGYGHPAWVAVRAEHFTQPIAVHVVAVQQTGVIVQRATPLAAPRGVPGRSGSFGPPVAQVASATGQTLRPVGVRAALSPTTMSPRAKAARNPQAGVASAAPRPAAPAAQSSRAASPMQSPRAQASAPVRTGTWTRSGLPSSAAASRARVASGWGGARYGTNRWGAPVVAGSVRT